ncbi:MAG TPA: DUF6799 domain-containing protein [Chthoniobacteraceae bacterium]|jgi:hypothetical protein
MNTIKTIFATLASAGLLTTVSSAQAADATTGTTGAQTSTTTTAATTEVRTGSAKPTGDDVGISARDGITLSGTAVLVTRNGVSETLQKEIALENGTRVAPDGKVTPQGGGTFTLRPTQILMFDGRLVNASGGSGTTGATTAPATTTAISTTATPATTTTATATTGTEQTGAAAADAEAARRASSTKQ